MTRRYEFHAYHGGAFGEVAERADVTTHEYEETAAAKAYAGRLSTRVKGPVDVAFADERPWEDRYITTASPSEHHAVGYRFERLT